MDYGEKVLSLEDFLGQCKLSGKLSWFEKNLI
jgi:hypothetical protein